MLSRSEWNTIAERSAASESGRRHVRRYELLRAAPLYAALALLGLVGYGVWWLQARARHLLAARPAPATTPAAHTGVPLWIWVALGVLALLTFIAFRPGRGTDSAPALLGKILGLGLAWLVLIGLTVGFAF